MRFANSAYIALQTEKQRLVGYDAKSRSGVEEMLGLSVGTAVFQTVWGAAWAACGSALFFLPGRMRNRTKLGWMLLGAGMLTGTLAVFLDWPYQGLEHSPVQDDARGLLFAWGFGAIALPAFIYWWVLKRGLKAEEAIQRETQLRHEVGRANANQARKESFFSAIKGWPLRAQCVISGTSSVLMLDTTMKSLRLIAYVEDAFKVRGDITIPLAEILSVEVHRPEIMEDYYRTEHVAVVSSKKKSPVGRSVLGWALLGPLGALVGAASGARTDIVTDVQERKVLDQRMRAGPPILVLGTRNPTYPIIKIAMASDHSVEEWKFRIQGAMAVA